MMGTVPERFRVALTIDAEFPDRPTEPGVTARILDVFAEEGVTATVFIQGRWAEAEPDLARRIAAEGHLVANHSHHHARLTLMTAAGIVRDVLAAERAILAATGRNPRPRPASARRSRTRSSWRALSRRRPGRRRGTHGTLIDIVEDPFDRPRPMRVPTARTNRRPSPGPRAQEIP